MIEAQSLDFLTEPLIVPSPAVQSVPLQTKFAAVPSSALTINTGLGGTLSASPALAAPAPTLKALPTTTRRFLGPGLTRMHPYYYVQYVPLDLKQNLVGHTVFYSFLLLILYTCTIHVGWEGNSFVLG